ncbi:hypothetical protein ACHAXT_011519 [Thalassiosira profunda]
MSTPRPPIDTSAFMSKYHHPMNVAAAKGDPNSRATISTAYSRAHGLYRQKQVDDEIERIRAGKKPSSSKITVTISPTNLLTLYHHHHHCLDVQLTSRGGKGRVVWFWSAWEKATDERVLKGAIAALDSSWTDEGESNDGDSVRNQGSTSGKKQSIIAWGGKAVASAVAAAASAQPEPNADAKRKRAAIAAESRIGQANKRAKPKQDDVEVVDLLDDSD